MSSTITTTDAATGITTKDSIVDYLGGHSVDNVTSPSTDTGQLEQEWTLKETVSATDAQGNQVGSTVTTTDTGSDTESELNGVVTDPGGANTHTVSTLTAAAAAAHAPPDTSSDTNTPPSQNYDIKQAILGVEISITELKKQVAKRQADLATTRGLILTADKFEKYSLWQDEKALTKKLADFQPFAAKQIAEWEKQIGDLNALLPPEEQPARLQVAPLEVVDINAAGRPGFWVGQIPVYGKAKHAAVSFSQGTPSGAIEGVGYSILAVTDVTLIRSLGTAVAKGGARLFARNVATSSADDIAKAVAQKAAPNRLHGPADLERISRIRSNLGVGKGRNIAFGEGHINGKDFGEVLGVSGRNTPGVQMPSQRIFRTGVDEFDRAFDGEVFVLENFARRLTPTDCRYDSAHFGAYLL